MRLKLLLSMIIAGMIVGCEDKIFNTDADPFNGENTIGEMQSLLDGTYYLLSLIFDQDYYEVLLRSDDVCLKQYTSPFLDLSSFDPGGDVNCFYFNASNIYNPDISDIYVLLYKAIINLNNLIVKYDQDGSCRSNCPYLGEAYLLRGYLYFLTMRIFGEIPVVKDIDVNYTVKRSSFDTIYAEIISDLEIAKKYLPLKNETISGQSKPNRGSAKAVQAEVYLSWAGYPLYDNNKYVLAAREAGEVIDSAEIFGFALEKDFRKLWTSSNRYSKENILSIFCGADENATLDYLTLNHMFTTGRAPASGNTSLYGYHPEITFFNQFPNNYRKDITFSTEYWREIEYVVDGETYIKTSNYKKFTHVNTPCEIFNIITYDKWANQYVQGANLPAYLNSEQTIYLFRYAHTLLTFAEASAKSGSFGNQVFEALNKVRRRSYGKDPDIPSEFDISTSLSIDDFADSVVLERSWEFACEPEGRWFDIVRLDMEQQIIENRHPEQVVKYMPSPSYFHDIPESEFGLNPNL